MVKYNWTYSVGEYLAGYTDINSYPALDKNGTIYMAIDTNPYSNGKLIAISTAGKNKWSLPISGVFMSSPAIGEDGVIFIGSSSGYLYAINPNGTIKWKLDIGNNCGIGCRSTVSIGSDDTIYFSLGDSVYAINNEGNLLWKAVLDSNIETPVFVGDGILYLETESGTIYAISSSSNGLLNSSWPITGHDNRNTRNVNSKIEYISNNQDNNTNNNGPGNITNPKSNFSDISPTDWYYTYVQDIAKAGITTGYPDGTYRPSALVTRAQMAAFIARAMKLNVPKECSNSPFYDIDTSKWYCKYVEAIKDADVTSGYPDGSYKPDDYVTRAQMAAFLVKALHLDKQPCTTKPFVDVPTDAWYCPYVQALKNAGITSGYPDGTYRPNAAVTRAIMAAFLAKAFIESNGFNELTVINSSEQAKSLIPDMANTIAFLSNSAKISASMPQSVIDALSSRSRNVTLLNNSSRFLLRSDDGYINELSNLLAVPFKFINQYDLRSSVKRVPVNRTYSCSGGGVYSYEGNYDEVNNLYSVHLVFNNCYEGSIKIDGSLDVNGKVNRDDYNFSINVPNLTFEDLDKNYKTVVSGFKENASGKIDTENYSINMNFTLNGKASIINESINKTFIVNFDSANVSLNETSVNETKTVFNGKFVGSWTDDMNISHSVGVSTKNFRLDFEGTLGGNENIVVNGLVHLNYSPVDFCANGRGVFKFSTLTPLLDDAATGKIIGGKLSVNDNVIIEWDSNGNVIVKLNGDVVYNGDVDSLLNNGLCSLPNDLTE